MAISIYSHAGTAWTLACVRACMMSQVWYPCSACAAAQGGNVYLLGRHLAYHNMWCVMMTFFPLWMMVSLQIFLRFTQKLFDWSCRCWGQFTFLRWTTSWWSWQLWSLPFSRLLCSWGMLTVSYPVLRLPMWPLKAQPKSFDNLCKSNFYLSWYRCCQNKQAWSDDMPRDNTP